MNKIISEKKIVLAIVFSVAMIASLGTLAVASAQSENTTQGTLMKTSTIQGSIDINKLLMSNVKTSFVDAASTAASSANGKIVGGDLGPDQGYYVYNFRVLDSDSKMHFVIIDAGNGKVLSNTEGFGIPGTPVSFNVQSPIGNVFPGDIQYSGQAIAIQTIPPQNK